jgi:rhodanese-related sulfurtransferase
VARITPEELKRRLDERDGGLMVIDTRSSLDVNATPYTIPGAQWILPEEINRRRHEIPSDREIVLYCT